MDNCETDAQRGGNVRNGDVDDEQTIIIFQYASQTPNTHKKYVDWIS